MRALRIWAAALLVLAGGGARAAVPESWRAFGTAAGAQLQAELADTDDPAVARLHRFIEAEGAKTPGAPLPAPIVRLWFDRDGRVKRAAFASLGDARLDADLRGLLMGHPMRVTPPAGMKQPLVLRLHLAVAS